MLLCSTRSGNPDASFTLTSPLGGGRRVCLRWSREKMEPITCFTVALHQALIALVQRAAKKDTVPISTPAVCTLIDTAQKVGFASSLCLPEKAAQAASEVALNPLIDMAKSLIDVLGDVSRDRKARREFNRSVIERLRDREWTRNESWTCPRSKRAVGVSLDKHSLSITCPYLLAKPL